MPQNIKPTMLNVNPYPQTTRTQVQNISSNLQKHTLTHKHNKLTQFEETMRYKKRYSSESWAMIANRHRGARAP